MPTSAQAQDSHPRKKVSVLDTYMTYVDCGSGAQTVVFLHGNPTSSYLWRQIIPHASARARCLAPDLVGMGDSGPSASGAYTYAEHYRYLNAWFDAVLPNEKLVLVVHDWGSGLGLHWANQHRERVSGVVYMEALVQPVRWDDWPDNARNIFGAMRSAAGEELVLQKNIFVERILPGSVLRGLSDEEMAVYRRPYREPGESRRPTLSWPRQIPIEGHPPDVTTIVEDYGRWLAEDASLPKLFVNAEPGSILVGKQREFCRRWPNQKEITVRGSHFVQEDSPHEIGEAIAAFLAQDTA